MKFNTFEQETTANDWIESVEGLQGNKLVRSIIDDHVSAWLQKVHHGKVVDLGCGTGISAPLCSEDIEYVGIDSSPTLVALAHERYGGPGRHLVCARLENTTLPDGAADGCFSIGTWLLLPDLMRAAKELHRILKKGATFIVISPNPGFFPHLPALMKNVQLTDEFCKGDFQASPGLFLRDVVFYKHGQEFFLSSFTDNGLEIDEAPKFYSPLNVNGMEIPFNIEIVGHKK